MKVEQVVFIEGFEADEPLEILATQGEKAALEYLMQWHYPGTHPISDKFSKGNSDSVYAETRENGSYVMSYNLGLGYISLEFTEDKVS